MFSHKHTGKSYIGTTSKTIDWRFNKHVVEARCTLHIKSKFHRAIRKAKFEKSVWTKTLLYVCDSSKEAFRAEIELIDTYDTFYNGYNTTLGGNSGPILRGKDNGMYGRTHTKEVKEKIGQLTKERLANKTYEEVHGIEKATHLRQQHSNDMKRIRLTRSGKGPNNPNAKTFEFIDPNGLIHLITGGMVKFCREHALRPDAIIDVSKGRRTEYKGWTVRLVSIIRGHKI
jgi:hypothetical protein